MSGVNIPLLRKAVEWAEAEAMKPPELCEWSQHHWVLAANPEDPAEARLRRALGKAEGCGTCYCIAGFIASSVDDAVATNENVNDTAADALGIKPYDYQERVHLFDPDNTITDVRRIAEDLAGERL